MQIIDLTSIDSTNTYLKQHYLELSNNTFVSAQTQTDGVGRSGRKWQSEKGGLYFSQLISDQDIFKQFQVISVLTAYSVVQVIKNYGLDNVKIKWPNDVYVNSQKICGILLQSISDEVIRCLIVGVGLNVNQKQFESDYIHPPTSLSLLLHRDIDLEEIKLNTYQQIVENLDKLKNGYDFYPEISELDYLQDREVYAIIENEKKKIKVVGIGSDYCLKARVDNKDISLYSGEVTFHI